MVLVLLIQAGLTQIGRAAKRPGSTVCFMLFIEMRYKSCTSLHRARTGFFAEPGPGDDYFAAGWVLITAPRSVKLTYGLCKNKIIYYTKHMFCWGYGGHEKGKFVRYTLWNKWRYRVLLGAYWPSGT